VAPPSCMGPWHPRRRAWGVAPPTVAPPPCMGRWRRRRRAWGVEMNRKDGAEGKEPAGCHNFPSALMRPIEYK